MKAEPSQNKKNDLNVFRDGVLLLRFNLFGVMLSPASTALILECCLLVLLFKLQVVPF